MAKKLPCGDTVDQRIEAACHRRESIRVPAKIDLEASNIKMRPGSKDSGTQHSLNGVHREIHAGKLNRSAIDIDCEWMIAAFHIADRGKQTLRDVERMLDNGGGLLAVHAGIGFCRSHAGCYQTRNCP